MNENHFYLSNIKKSDERELNYRRSSNVSGDDSFVINEKITIVYGTDTFREDSVISIKKSIETHKCEECKKEREDIEKTNRITVDFSFKNGDITVDRRNFLEENFYMDRKRYVKHVSSYSSEKHRKLEEFFTSVTTIKDIDKGLVVQMVNNSLMDRKLEKKGIDLMKKITSRVKNKLIYKRRGTINYTTFQGIEKLINGIQNDKQSLDKLVEMNSLNLLFHFGNAQWKITQIVRSDTFEIKEILALLLECISCINMFLLDIAHSLNIIETFKKSLFNKSQVFDYIYDVISEICENTKKYNRISVDEWTTANYELVNVLYYVLNSILINRTERKKINMKDRRNNHAAFSACGFLMEKINKTARDLAYDRTYEMFIKPMIDKKTINTGLVSNAEFFNLDFGLKGNITDKISLFEPYKEIGELEKIEATNEKVVTNLTITMSEDLVEPMVLVQTRSKKNSAIHYSKKIEDEYIEVLSNFSKNKQKGVLKRVLSINNDAYDKKTSLGQKKSNIISLFLEGDATSEKKQLICNNIPKIEQSLVVIKEMLSVFFSDTTGSKYETESGRAYIFLKEMTRELVNLPEEIFALLKSRSNKVTTCDEKDDKSYISMTALMERGFNFVTISQISNSIIDAFFFLSWRNNNTLSMITSEKKIDTENKFLCGVGKHRVDNFEKKLYSNVSDPIDETIKIYETIFRELKNEKSTKENKRKNIDMISRISFDYIPITPSTENNGFNYYKKPTDSNTKVLSIEDVGLEEIRSKLSENHGENSKTVILFDAAKSMASKGESYNMRGSLDKYVLIEKRNNSGDVDVSYFIENMCMAFGVENIRSVREKFRICFNKDMETISFYPVLNDEFVYKSTCFFLDSNISLITFRNDEDDETQDCFSKYKEIQFIKNLENIKHKIKTSAKLESFREKNNYDGESEIQYNFRNSKNNIPFRIMRNGKIEINEESSTSEEDTYYSSSSSSSSMSYSLSPPDSPIKKKKISGNINKRLYFVNNKQGGKVMRVRVFLYCRNKMEPTSRIVIDGKEYLFFARQMLNSRSTDTTKDVIFVGKRREMNDTNRLISSSSSSFLSKKKQEMLHDERNLEISSLGRVFGNMIEISRGQIRKAEVKYRKSLSFDGDLMTLDGKEKLSARCVIKIAFENHKNRKNNHTLRMSVESQNLNIKKKTT